MNQKDARFLFSPEAVTTFPIMGALRAMTSTGFQHIQQALSQLLTLKICLFYSEN